MMDSAASESPDHLQFVINSLANKSYVTTLPNQTLLDVRNLIHEEWDDHQYPPHFNFRVNDLLISTKQEVRWTVGDIFQKGWPVELAERPEHIVTKSQGADVINSKRRRMAASVGAVELKELSPPKEESDSEVEVTPIDKTPATDYLQEHLTTPLLLKKKEPKGPNWKVQDIIRALDLWHEYKHQAGANKAAFCRSIEASEEFDYVMFVPKQLRRMLAKENEYRAKQVGVC